MGHIDSANKVTKNINKTIERHIQGHKLIQYYYERKLLVPGTTDKIDWGALGRASKGLPPSERLWMVKLGCKFCVTGDLVHRRKVWISPVCPLCENADESLAHMFVRLELSDCRIDAVLMIEKWMEVIETHPEIKLVMLPTIFHSSTFSEHTTFSQDNMIAEAALEQNQIRFLGFLSGRVSTKWTTIQEAYFKTPKHSK